jgi:WD40 repeat protein
MIISTEDNYSPTMTLWDTLTGKKVRTLSGQPGVIAMAFSLSGLIVASTARDLTIRLWNTLSGLQTSILKQSDEAVAISVSPDGSTVASGSDDLLIRLWDARGVQDHERRPRDGIFEIVFSPDGSMVATSAADLFVRLWDVSTGLEMQALYHECGTHAFAFNPTFSIIVSASVDMMLRVWNCSTGKLMQCIQLELVVERISFSERGYIIRTEAGDIDIEHLKPLPWRKPARVSPPIDLFDVSHQWVVYQGERLLWLPSEYRATCWASNGETVAIGHASGYVTILQPDRGRPWILP